MSHIVYTHDQVHSGLLIDQAFRESRVVRKLLAGEDEYKSARVDVLHHAFEHHVSMKH